MFAFATNGEYHGGFDILGAWFYAPAGTYADPPTVVLPDATTTPDPVGEIPPDSTPVQTFTFNAPEPGNWFDPVAADAYLYELLGGGEFLEVRGVPGYSDLQIAWGDNYASILDLDLDPGESYFFGTGVTSFMLSGFTPSFDAEDPNAIPTYLDFTGSPTELRMTALALNASSAVPVPATLPLLGLGLAAIGYSRRKRKQHTSTI
jgi:PEP-CTERM motif